MNIIYVPRGAGKTTEMIYEIFQKQNEGYNCYLICTNSMDRNSIEAKARELSMPFQNKPLLAETLMRQLSGEEPLNKRPLRKKTYYSLLMIRKTSFNQSYQTNVR